MPQTVEAINHAQAAEVPIVVAVNKIDKPDANPQKIRQQMTDYGVIPEEYGGDTMFVDISARQGPTSTGCSKRSAHRGRIAGPAGQPGMEAQGVAIEAHLDAVAAGRHGLVQRGTLHVGDSIVAGDAYGRVRRMLDEFGGDITAAVPSRPVQVVGFTSCPARGHVSSSWTRTGWPGRSRASCRSQPQRVERVAGQAGQPGGPGRGAQGDQPAQPGHQGRQLRTSRPSKTR